MMNGRDELERARSALFTLDAGCDRDGWVRIGMAAKAAGLPEDDFVDWSATGGNYGGERDAKAVWKSIDVAGGIGAGTLYRMAGARGWRDTHNGAQAPRVSRPKLMAQAKPQAAQKPARDLTATFESYLPAACGHPYIVAKCGMPDGLRVVPADDTTTIIAGQRVAGWLAVPVRSLDGALHTVQYIPPPGAGKKLNAPDASFGNGLFVVGDITANGTVYVCEGIGQAWACAKADYHAAAVVSFGCGRFRTVAKVLLERYPAARIVIVADQGKQSDAEAIAREVRGAWVEMPVDTPSNYDANDYARDQGAEALADLLRAPKTPVMRYQLLSAEELCSLPAQRWRVRGVVPADGCVAVSGGVGSGKSFLVLDMAAAVAEGAPHWFGQRVTSAPVVYCALEGQGGLNKRVRAWSIHHGRALPANLRFVVQSFDLRNESDVDDLVAAVLAVGGHNGLTVIDTLSRAAPGADENSSVDMGELIDGAKELQRRIGGTVLLVHHVGKDSSKGMRGHSSLFAALDSAIEVTRNNADDRREWCVSKSKDDRDGARHAFRLRSVELDDDEHGDPVTSCIVEPDDSERAVQRAPSPQGANQVIAADALAEPLRVSRHFGKGDAPPTRPCIEVETAVGIVAAQLPVDPKHRTARAREAIKGLRARQFYGCKDGWLWRA